ncbi:hypothetical protein [Lactiplantibacillus mudanjiangensis]|uniref:Uncharacterized protein n=1 Tax=Lactiplantibacillus mudanjiangensis TaxID=1296538 RepID=A0A660DYR4_9LACO|nr:hypothetical protein [Lactiplantibacillus mudanjiangensis]VDG17992.1 hypothetical protein MUDAN_BIHEEGNE_00518 [Lactiplantibacillus mudanjiangensis]VDG24842.1 hypothetical protein MUDAN_IGPPGNFN_00871 [Lactiplantibacillus mudanjiangensis]VDG28411.1 hypothetical protein MUDAN_MDHGFNIF_00598 [Lactiplantibacillus mudanjiangensis]VDG32305.1 hypothetical protein MUDAN_DOGOELCO_01567 [Lactiplantibacillus mudanjiangensis]
MLTTLQTQLIQQALPSYPLTPTQLAHLCLPEPHNSHENQRYLQQLLALAQAGRQFEHFHEA